MSRVQGIRRSTVRSLPRGRAAPAKSSGRPAIAHIRAQNVEVTDKKRGCEDTWQAWVRDPNGVRIELFEYTPQSAQFAGGDRVADW